MKRTFLLLGLAALLSTASAEFYFGFPSSTAVSGSGVAPFIGVQAGSHEVAANLGVRGYFESDATLSGLFLQGGADVFYTAGSNSKFYVGGGLGVANLDVGSVSGTLVYLNPVIGGDFDSGTAISYFIEASPRVYVGSGAVPLFYLRSGINFHLGGAPEPVFATPVGTTVAEPVVQTPAAPQPVAAAAPEVGAGNGTYTDEDGNVWLEPYAPQTADAP